MQTAPRGSICARLKLSFELRTEPFLPGDTDKRRCLQAHRSDIIIMDEKSKQRLRSRYMRGMKHEVSYEEQRARKQRAPGGNRRGRGPRQREWDEDDDAPAFETMGAGPSGPPLVGQAEPDLPTAVVAGVHRGQVDLNDGRRARLAPTLAGDPTLRLVVGDEVAVSDRSGQARVEALRPRRSVLARQDPSAIGRPLVLAANVDLGVITVAAADPPPRPGLIDRMLIALELGGVAPIVCMTKIDLLDGDARDHAERVLDTYRELGVLTIACSSTTGAGVEDLRDALSGKTAVLVGHSGVGKSTVLNALDAAGDRRTGAVRDADGRGRHTTTSSSLRRLEDGTCLIDTPGVRSFGLDALLPEDLARGFPEFDEAGPCRFGDCTHRDEPDCAVRSAASADGGAVREARYRSYLRILEDGVG